jgi:poly(3-hydroxybutyrate) depolymerase
MKEASMFASLTIARRSAALVALVAIATLATTTSPSLTRAADLPALAAAKDQTSVSGISSGAYMAGQYQIAHSASVVGAAIIAGGPYGCAEAKYGGFMLPSMRLASNAWQSLDGCMLDRLSFYGTPDVPRMEADTRALASAGRIDPLAGLARQRVYIFSGGKDNVVKPRMAVLAAELYLRLGVPRAQIKTAHLDGAGHGFVTVREPAQACGLSKPPYIVGCGNYDQAWHLLSHIYELAGPRVERPTGDLILFDQQPFTRDLPTATMSDNGMVFIPKSCRTEPGCRIHIAFHGCRQNRKAAGETFITETGYTNWADANRIVVLFPDVTVDRTRNPLGCWDWWGYTSFDYLTRSAPQITAVRRMVERLSARP